MLSPMSCTDLRLAHRLLVGGIGSASRPPEEIMG